MRIVLPLIALALTTAAAPAPPAQVEEGIPMRELQVSPDPALCRDRIHEVREERGLPLLNRENAAPDEPLMILAVDKRIDGCSVMVMAYDTNDIRPVPTAPAGPPRVQRIPGQ